MKRLLTLLVTLGLVSLFVVACVSSSGSSGSVTDADTGRWHVACMDRTTSKLVKSTSRNARAQSV